jgi:hypothetical protein
MWWWAWNHRGLLVEPGRTRVLGWIQRAATRAVNQLTKKQSLIAPAWKLLRVFYAMITKNVPYDGEKMMQDIQRPGLQVVV